MSIKAESFVLSQLREFQLCYSIYIFYGLNVICAICDCGKKNFARQEQSSSTSEINWKKRGNKRKEDTEENGEDREENGKKGEYDGKRRRI